MHYCGPQRNNGEQYNILLICHYVQYHEISKCLAALLVGCIHYVLSPAVESMDLHVFSLFFVLHSLWTWLLPLDLAPETITTLCCHLFSLFLVWTQILPGNLFFLCLLDFSAVNRVWKWIKSGWRLGIMEHGGISGSRCTTQMHSTHGRTKAPMGLATSEDNAIAAAICSAGFFAL